MKVENRYILLSALLVILLIYCQLISTSESFSSLARRIRGYNILNNGYKIEDNGNEGDRTPWSLSSQEYNLINEIVRKIIQEVNQQLNTTYYPTNLDRVNKSSDNNQNYRFIVEMFMNEARTYTSRRVIIDFTLIQGTNNVQINTINFSNASPEPVPKYYLTDKKNNSLRNNDLYHQNPYKSYLINEGVTDFKQNVTEDAEFSKFHKKSTSNNYNIVGNVKSSIDYSKFDNPIHKESNNDTDFNEWILPLGIDGSIKSQSAYPCRQQGDWWDSNGVDHTDPKTSNCIGINSSTEKRKLVAQNYPAGIRQFGNDEHPNHYSWMFNWARGIPSFPVKTIHA